MDPYKYLPMHKVVGDAQQVDPPGIAPQPPQIDPPQPPTIMPPQPPTIEPPQPPMINPPMPPEVTPPQPPQIDPPAPPLIPTQPLEGIMNVSAPMPLRLIMPIATLIEVGDDASTLTCGPDGLC